VYFKYYHCAENIIYGELCLEKNNFCEGQCDPFLIFDNSNVILDIELDVFSQGTILSSIKIKDITKYNNSPLNFSFINEKYINVIKSHYKYFHFGYDFQNQGWDDIIDGRQIDNSRYYDELFFIKNNVITLYGGVKLWINDEWLYKLDELYNKNT
jgi:hypothetical protein